LVDAWRESQITVSTAAPDDNGSDNDPT
jgi:hypothetical protein